MKGLPILDRDAMIKKFGKPVIPVIEHALGICGVSLFTYRDRKMLAVGIGDGPIRTHAVVFPVEARYIKLNPNDVYCGIYTLKQVTLADKLPHSRELRKRVEPLRDIWQAAVHHPYLDTTRQTAGECPPPFEPTGSTRRVKHQDEYN